VRRYVNALTEVMRRLSSELGIEAGKHHEHVGLWVDRDSPSAYPGSAASKDLAKIGAVGVRISRWCTMHGFALNLAPDLSLYRVIVPCGIRELGVSSIATLGGAPIAIETAARRAFELFGAVFEARLERFDDRSGSSLESLVEKSSPAVTASRT
jgi:lipoyl(octanoyl) transferase